MILPFSTKIDGKETFFVERIHKGLREFYFEKHLHLFSFQNDKFNHNFYHRCFKKIHTIREDKKNRWKVGTKIDFFINARQKNMFRFAPVLPVVSTQEFEINWHSSNDKLFVRVYVDGESFARIDFDKELYVSGQMMIHLANNEGFDTIEDFFNYFNKDYTGKLIHWTDKKY